MTRSYLYPPLVDLVKDAQSVQSKNTQEYNNASMLSRGLVYPSIFTPGLYQPKEGEDRNFLSNHTQLYFSAMAAAMASGNQAQYAPGPSAEEIYRLRHFMSNPSAIHPHHHHLLMRPGMMPLGVLAFVSLFHNL